MMIVCAMDARGATIVTVEPALLPTMVRKWFPMTPARESNSRRRIIALLQRCDGLRWDWYTVENEELIGLVVKGFNKGRLVAAKTPFFHSHSRLEKAGVFGISQSSIAEPPKSPPTPSFSQTTIAFESPATPARPISRLEFKPTSGAELQTTPEQTTTIVGSHKTDMKHIVNEMGNVKSTDFGPKPGGFNILNVPDDYWKSPGQFWEEYNRPWLDLAIQRGDVIICATPPEAGVLTRIENGKPEKTGYGCEYDHLVKNGYTYDPISKEMRKA